MAKKELRQILDINWRKEEQKAYLIKYVSQIDWLKNNKLTPDLETLEILYRKLRNKYPITIGYIMNSSTNSWVCMIKTTDNHQWVNTVYGCCFHELMLKSIVVFEHFIIFGDKQKDGGHRDKV